MATRVVEFKSQVEYDRWLNAQGEQVKIINVSTTKRWSLWNGFLGDNKTYTVTYETKSKELLVEGNKKNFNWKEFYKNERNISNDNYKLYLVKKFAIEKNDILGKYVVDENFFLSLEDAINYADSVDKNQEKEYISLITTPKKCPYCRTDNASGVAVCSSCRKILPQTS